MLVFFCCQFSYAFTKIASMSSIQLIVAKDPQEVAVRAGALIANAIKAKARPVIGLATGTILEECCGFPRDLHCVHLLA